MHTVTWNDHRGSYSVACDGKTAHHLAMILEKIPERFEVNDIHVYYLTTELDINTGNYIQRAN